MSHNELLDRTYTGKASVIADLLYTGIYILAGALIIGISFLVWNLDHVEWKLWKQPPDPVLEVVAGIVYPQNREWEGSPTELAQLVQPDMPANRLTKYLNVNTCRLLEAYKVVYENRTSHKPPHPADLHGRNRVTATLVTAVTVKTGFPNHRCHRSNCHGRQKFNYCRKGLHFGTPFFVASGPYPHVALHFACVPIGIIHSQIVLLNTINYFLDGIRLGILDIGIAYKNGTGSMGFHPHCWVDNNPFRVSSPSHGNCTVRSNCTPGLL